PWAVRLDPFQCRGFILRDATLRVAPQDEDSCLPRPACGERSDRIEDAIRVTGSHRKLTSYRIRGWSHARRPSPREERGEGGSRYSGSPVRNETTARSLNRPRVLPSRTNLTRSAPKVTLRIASGLAWATACTTGPASILPCGGHCSSTHWMSGRFSDISFLNTATADWPYS